MLVQNNKRFLDEKDEKFYQRGLRRQWQAIDLPWEFEIKLSNTQQRGGAHLLSQIYWGELASYRLVEQLLAQTDDGATQAFLQSQLTDELRHIEVFGRYLDLLGGVVPRTAAMTELVDGMLALPTAEEKVVGMHLLIEGMALEIFHVAVQQIADPLLQALLRRVFADEARHVAFGATHARHLIAQLDSAGRARVAREGGHFALVAAALIREQQQAATEFGLDLRYIQQRCLRTMFRRIQQSGLTNALALW